MHDHQRDGLERQRGRIADRPEHRLRARLREHHARVARTRIRIWDWLRRHPDSYVAWSAGKDSTALAHLAHSVAPGIPVVHYESGLDYPETGPYMAEVASMFGWRYEPIRTGDALAEMIRGGTWDHEADGGYDQAAFWDVLVAGPHAEARRRFGDGMLIGLRAEESGKRARLLRWHHGELHRPDGTHSIAPIGMWITADVWAYHHTHRIPEHPVYTRLVELGAPASALRLDVAVGSNAAQYGRLMWLRRGWPELWREYQRLLPRLREMS